MAEISHPDSVLMVGSIPYENVSQVLTKVCGALPGRLHSIPDGEIGERHLWILWQASRLPSEAVRPEFGGSPSPSEKKRYDVDSISPTLYDEAALSSYAKFVDLRRQGVIPAGVRFQVCLPTPLAVVFLLCKPEYCAEIEPLYEQRLVESVKRITQTIPPEDLVIQWDICAELLLLEFERGTLTETTFLSRIEPYFAPIGKGISDRLARVFLHIPSEVPIAFHLCYGDYGHVHWLEPSDLSLLVDCANNVTDLVNSRNRIEYVHMPVPRNRTDREYFEPLRGLRLDVGTRLYLGLVHANDEQGTQERIESARSVYSHPFGIATECGLGRTPTDDIDSIFEILKVVTTKILGKDAFNPLSPQPQILGTTLSV